MWNISVVNWELCQSDIQLASYVGISGHLEYIVDMLHKIIVHFQLKARLLGQPENAFMKQVSKMENFGDQG